MTQAVRDENRVVALLAVSSVDGVTPLPLQVNPVTGRVLVNMAQEGLAPTVGFVITRDDNRVDVGRGGRTDNAVPMPFHASPTARLLVE